MLFSENKNVKYPISIGLMLFFWLAGAQADSGKKVQGKEKAALDLNIEIDTYARLIPSRRVEAQSGKIEVVDSASECRYLFKAFGKLPVIFSLNQQYIGIENSSNMELPAHLVGLTADIETTFPFFAFAKTYLRLGISPGFYGDDWSFPSSCFRIPLRTYLVYRPEKEWTFLAGLAVYPEFEQELLPIFGLIYKPNERLTFNLVPKRPQISFSLNKQLTLFGEGGSSFNSEFEVTKDSQKNIVLSYKETHLGVGAKYKFNEFLQGSISTGGVFNRSLKYRDNSGKLNIKDSAYTELRIEAKI